MSELPGVVEPNAVYTLEEAMSRLRMGRWAWRKFAAKGTLRTLPVGNRTYIRGSEIFAALDRAAEQGGTE